MRAVVQRTSSSYVEVDNEKVAEISDGLTVLLGVKSGDTLKNAEYIMDKILNLRIFEDETGKMNNSVLDIQGEILVISQFTLYGDVRKGRRPSFTEAALPDEASAMIDYCIDYARKYDINIKTGIFAANMQVSLINNGPCTIILDSEKNF
ncbi:D-aminoacyl-tRNA deacylase [Candidatus Syntrophocurvum alkaliphilum]|uniref:D-aminoacyl-tRNA deacylase n=1 Tax=Candidatus Syntrophocurvum alkaliphilum TaxID=2293317 RepID=A0A6I6D7X7_9FIRM|nr:D-aminoacyl-tRNA deacylase [Candidatus Syntrophocurvum alkaliphilum]QGT99113.1 D-aminoacyl-tRNA deacylase [Candidatus Syntrophocurvum alkaliphilum]